MLKATRKSLSLSSWSLFSIWECYTTPISIFSILTDVHCGYTLHPVHPPTCCSILFHVSGPVSCLLWVDPIMRGSSLNKAGSPHYEIHSYSCLIHVHWDLLCPHWEQDNEAFTGDQLLFQGHYVFQTPGHHYAGQCGWQSRDWDRL